LPDWLSRRLVDDDAALTLVRVGPVVVQGVPCDLTAGFGRQLKQAAASRGWQPVLIGFANDYIGYCLPEPLYETGEYEATLAFNGPHAGRLVVERLIELIGSFN
jgi:hypothetical protein